MTITIPGTVLAMTLLAEWQLNPQRLVLLTPRWTISATAEFWFSLLIEGPSTDVYLRTRNWLSPQL